MSSSLHGYLERVAADTPDEFALVDAERRLTYAELNARANQVGRALLAAGVGRGERVGLYLDKSLEAVVGIYGILKAGAAYVPLDPKAPTSRLGYVAGNCDISVLFSSAKKAGSWPGLNSSGATIEHVIVADANTDEIESELPVTGATTLDELPDDNLDIASIDQDLAYILYTSGSTGTPKGVMLTHRNAMAFVEWACDEFGIRPDDRLSSHAPFHFDLSVFDLFGASRSGASLHLVPQAASVFPMELIKFVNQHEITVWYSVPSILTVLTERGNLQVGDLPSIRILFFAGEVFPTKYLSRLMGVLPGVEFANLYGPTETNVCTYYRVPEPPPEDAPPVSIGKAIANDETFVITSDGRVAAPGEPGELMVRGATVMRGYWGDPDRTGERLIPDPRGVDDMVYSTGDLVEEMPDGNYRFLGRSDNQIKSRGYRIELGDIENALYSNPHIAECAVLAVPDDMITNRLKAFVVLDVAGTQASVAAELKKLVPKYMVPESFEAMTELPKTSNGKIDRQCLQRAAEKESEIL